MIRDTHAEQKVINEKVKEQQERLVNLSNEQFSESKRARGAIKELMDKNKVIAAQEIADLRTDANSKLTALRAKQAQLSTDYAQELTAATTGLYAKLKQDKIEQVSAIEGLTKDLGVAKVSTAQQIKDLEEDFKVAFTDLSGVVSSNHASYERGMEEITGVVFDYKAAADADRALIREEQRVMNNDLNKRISHAIMLGEAKAKEVLETASANIDAMKRALVSDIGQKVEHMANTVLDAVLEDRQTIANNYLSLKGYAGAAQDKIIDYVQKGHGKGLGSIGDLLQAMAISADIKTEPALGILLALARSCLPSGALSSLMSLMSPRSTASLTSTSRLSRLSTAHTHTAWASTCSASSARPWPRAVSSLWARRATTLASGS